jgi:hypothetical protein
VNLETHRPIDLRNEQTAEVFANWLRQHPGVEIIVRDRAGAYAEGGKQGAPDAIQIADRFDLSANASAALDEVLRSSHRRVEHVISELASEPEPTVVPSLPPPAPSGAKSRELEARSRRIARWQTVREQHAAGTAIRSIAKDLGMSRMTVRRLLQTPDPPRNRPPQRPRPRGLTSPSLSRIAAIWKHAGKTGAQTSPSFAEKWKRLIIKGADHCSIACWSPGAPSAMRTRLSPRLCTELECDTTEHPADPGSSPSSGQPYLSERLLR